MQSKGIIYHKKILVRKITSETSYNLLRTCGPKLYTLFHCPFILLYDLRDEGSKIFTTTVYQSGLNVCLKIRLVLILAPIQTSIFLQILSTKLEFI